KKICPQLTMCQKAARCAKFIALTDDVNSARITYMDQVQVLAKKHGWCVYLYHFVLNFNSFPGLSKGNRWKLTEFIESHKETLCNDYARLSHAQKNNYEVEIIKMRADKQRMVRDNPRAVQRDMQATFAAMDQEHIIQWTAICSHLGVEGFYVAVRGGIEDLSGPKL
ncbi:hypothetical protein BDR07DRAFT_1261595, partial [Suillus spraguei]